MDIEFFQKYLSEDIIEKIKNTSFFKDFSCYFTAKEKMTPAVFDVVRNYAFDIDSLDEIETQKHLISLYEQIILEILQAGIKLSHIYPDCSIIGYFTSISSNYRKFEWHSTEYYKYRNSDEIFNQLYHHVFRSIVKLFGNNWILEHNEYLLSKEIKCIKMIAKNYTQAYETLLVMENF